jgi:5-methyltetrahydropteroyltriglutamate--homocysteine methyltransferase
MGGHDNAELREIEDACIRDVVALQEGLGLKGVTDGEYRRTFFHLDFLERIDGVVVGKGIPAKFQGGTKKVEFAPPKMSVGRKLKRTREISLEDFAYLKSATRNTAKLCIPSPTMLHFRGGRKAVDEAAYPDMTDFFTDLAGVYAEEIAALGALGCTYLQLDDTNLAYLCDPAIQESTRQLGEDPAALPRQYAKLINDAISGRPKDMRVTIHLCRGNFKSAWVAEGGYEPVAEVLFNELDVDGYFLEYDDERSGDFAPLRFVPKGKSVVLGLVSSKLPTLESKDELKTRIDEAAKYMPMDQMALSPQCGFSSTVHGNDITFEDEKAKIRLVVEMADEIWGSA